MLLGRGRSDREHGGPILEGAGEPWYPCVVWQTGVTVARRQSWVQERLLRGMVRLRLALLRLGQSCCWSRGGGVASAELREVTRIRIAAQAAVSSSQRGGGGREWDAVIIQWESRLKHLQVVITIHLRRIGM